MTRNRGPPLHLFEACRTVRESEEVCGVYKSNEVPSMDKRQATRLFSITFQCRACSFSNCLTREKCVNMSNTGAGSSSSAQESFSPIVLCGLHNIGNTCYFNSGLQLLLNCHQFVSALRFANPLLGPSKNTHPILRGRFSAQHTRRLLQMTQNTVDELETASQLSVSPRQLVAQLAVVNPQFEGFLQQDCPEMINSLLGSIDDETRMATSTKEELAALDDSTSCRDALVLRLRDEIDTENEKIERLELQRRAGIYREGTFRPPLLFHSGVGDIYRGYTLSEITCDACSYCSRVIDEFTTLHVEIPTDSQRVEYAKRHPSAERPGKKKPESLRWYQKVGAFVSWLFCCCLCCGDSVDYPLTLEECLDIHFDAERLKGSNKYKCGKCGTLGQATKKVSILQLPEVLLLHNKRFTYGTYWTRKKHEHVIFPVSADCPSTPRGLDMSSYCVRGLPLPRTTTYALSGVVNHHGSYSGGHYTAFVNKGEHGWVLCNDDRVARATAEEVADSQEYVLMYQLTSLVPQSNVEAILQQRARQYLLGAVPMPDFEKALRGGDADTGGDVAGHDSSDDTDGSRVCYVSRLWLFRMSCFCEPGIVSNLLPGPGPNRPTFSPAWFFVPVLREDYTRFAASFGGPSSLVSKTAYEQMCSQEADFIRQVRETATQ